MNITIFFIIFLSIAEIANASSLTLRCNGNYKDKNIILYAFFPVIDNPTDGVGRVIINSDSSIENKTMKTYHFFAQGASSFNWLMDGENRISVEFNGKYSIYTHGIFREYNQNTKYYEKSDLSGVGIKCKTVYGDDGVQNFKLLE